MELLEGGQPPSSRVLFHPHPPQHRPKIVNKIVRGEGIPHTLLQYGWELAAPYKSSVGPARVSKRQSMTPIRG